MMPSKKSLKTADELVDLVAKAGDVKDEYKKKENYANIFDLKPSASDVLIKDAYKKLFALYRASLANKQISSNDFHIISAALKTARDALIVAPENEEAQAWEKNTKLLISALKKHLGGASIETDIRTGRIIIGRLENVGADAYVLTGKDIFTDLFLEKLLEQNIITKVDVVKEEGLAKAANFSVIFSADALKSIDIEKEVDAAKAEADKAIEAYRVAKEKEVAEAAIKTIIEEYNRVSQKASKLLQELNDKKIPDLSAQRQAYEISYEAEQLRDQTAQLVKEIFPEESTAELKEKSENLEKLLGEIGIATQAVREAAKLSNDQLIAALSELQTTLLQSAKALNDYANAGFLFFTQKNADRFLSVFSGFDFAKKAQERLKNYREGIGLKTSTDKILSALIDKTKILGEKLDASVKQKKDLSAADQKKLAKLTTKHENVKDGIFHVKLHADKLKI
ncbi:MAG: hypothetical protein A2V89_01915 [Gammaproteobacteria bacterium RBG_16_37_9]|nr:MAG: hypothetical protein A2V89_01915 [Gammaproteobacteria bacterium RBG_16_37_9]